MVLIVQDIQGTPAYHSATVGLKHLSRTVVAGAWQINSVLRQLEPIRCLPKLLGDWISIARIYRVGVFTFCQIQRTRDKLVNKTVVGRAWHLGLSLQTNSFVVVGNAEALVLATLSEGLRHVIPIW
jgi:hypothetical protein